MLRAAGGGERLSDLRDRAIVLLMLTSGLRASEVINIDVADLQVVEGHHVVWAAGKGGAASAAKSSRMPGRPCTSTVPLLASVPGHSSAVSTPCDYASRPRPT